MDETFVVIMLKDLNTGLFEKEMCTLKITENDNLITNTFIFYKDGSYFISVKLTTDRDVLDWEYTAIFDYYDEEILLNEVDSVIEISDSYNPTWEIIFPYDNDIEVLESKFSKILSLHKKELLDVYKVIEENKNNYN